LAPPPVPAVASPCCDFVRLCAAGNRPRNGGIEGTAEVFQDLAIPKIHLTAVHTTPRLVWKP
jgi:hypothetical protein